MKRLGPITPFCWRQIYVLVKGCYQKCPLFTVPPHFQIRFAAPRISKGIAEMFYRKCIILISLAPSSFKLKICRKKKEVKYEHY